MSTNRQSKTRGPRVATLPTGGLSRNYAGEERDEPNDPKVLHSIKGLDHVADSALPKAMITEGVERLCAILEATEDLQGEVLDIAVRLGLKARPE